MTKARFSKPINCRKEMFENKGRFPISSCVFLCFKYFIGKSSSWQQSSRWITHIVTWTSNHCSAKRIGLETHIELIKKSYPSYKTDFEWFHIQYTCQNKEKYTIYRIIAITVHSPLVQTILREDQSLLQPRQGRGRGGDGRSKSERVFSVSHPKGRPEPRDCGGQSPKLWVGGGQES